MTEEILNSAILQLKAKATERFGIIKDLYHRPATSETADQIVQHAIALAQLEGAMITLQSIQAHLPNKLWTKQSPTLQRPKKKNWKMSLNQNQQKGKDELPRRKPRL